MFTNTIESSYFTVSPPLASTAFELMASQDCIAIWRVVDGLGRIVLHASVGGDVAPNMFIT
jgi:hypothetical protein